MPNDQSPLFVQSDAQSIAQDVAYANEMLEQSLDDNAGQLSPAVGKSVTENEAQAMRQRAQRQRVNGAKQLARRHDGIASQIRKVELKERVIGSSFLRWFAGIEYGIYVAHKHSERMLGENAGTVKDTIKAMVAKLEADAEDALKKLNFSLAAMEAEQSSEWGLSYSQPAANIEVQLRHPLSARVVSVFQKYDEVVAGMVKLEWNGEIEEKHREQVENDCKKGLRDLAVFLSRTLRGYSRKLPAPSVAPAAAVVEGSPEPVEQEAA
jgi:hypothetical protein